jgi:hypothetical protein
MKEAQKDMDAAVSYFKQGNYKDAGYKLAMTYFDIEVCEDLIKSKPNAAVLAGAKTNSTYYPDLTAGSSLPQPPDNQMVVDYLQKYRGRLMNIAQEMKVGAYEKIAPEFDAVQQEMLTAYQLAKSTLSIKDRLVFQYADTPTSVDFLQSSLRSLQDLQEYLALDDAIPVEAAKKLYAAELNLLVGRDVLENQTLIFESGGSINWKTLQQYNLSLQSAEIALYKAKQEIMKTAIIAPSGGTVVSVDLKKSSVLSAQDYSSKTAIKLVDTSSIRFEGLVDEIDIMKLVGASSSFIRWPFILEGILYAILATILSVGLLYLGFRFLSPIVNRYLGELMDQWGGSLLNYFNANLIWIILLQLAVGILIGSICSWIAIRKHLRV